MAFILIRAPRVLLASSLLALCAAAVAFVPFLAGPALAQGGQILLLDEPTTFLDYRHQMWIVELLERLHRDQGLTVVTATHDLNWTLMVSDSVLALRDGVVAFRGATAGLFTAGRLEEIYGTRFDLVETGGRPVPLVVPARNGS